MLVEGIGEYWWRSGADSSISATGMLELRHEFSPGGIKASHIAPPRLPCESCFIVGDWPASLTFRVRSMTWRMRDIS